MAQPYMVRQICRVLGRGAQLSTCTALVVWIPACCCCWVAQRRLRRPSAVGSPKAHAAVACGRGVATGWMQDSGRGASPGPDQLGRKCRDYVSALAPLLGGTY